MKYLLEDISGKNVEIYTPITAKININYLVPADDLVVTFNYDKELPELKKIYAYSEDVLMFEGFIDEQKVICDNRGVLLEISARSRVSLLLDNEAFPQTYNKPSLSTIFSRHIEPYGFTKYYGDTTSFADQFIVSKGMSEWDVLKKFCNTYLGVNPVFMRDGSLNATGSQIRDTKRILISNSKNGLKYNDISKIINRYGVISKVILKSSKTSGYTSSLSDKNLIDKGIIATRFYDITSASISPQVCADSIISNSKKNMYIYKANCIGCHLQEIGSKVYIDDKYFNLENDMTLIKIKYILNSFGETTEFTMRTEEQ